MSSYDQFPPNDDDDGLSMLGPVFTASTIAAAGVLYLLTRHPLLAAILPWLHGGWPTFSTGLWILRSDPVRSRAWVCLVFYFAAGCWKAAVTALGTMIALGCIGAWCGLQPTEKEIMATTIAFLIGLALNILLATIAVIAALICKVRVCVRANLQLTLRHDLSRAAQIGPMPSGSSFTLEFVVVATAVVLPLILIGIAFTMLVVGEKAQVKPNDIITPLIVAIGICGIPLSGIPLVIWLCSRTVAKSPQECWPAGTT
jgi:hypothetical protein